MENGSEFLITLTQLSAGIVAIMVGFIVSRTLNAGGEFKRWQKDYASKVKKLTKAMEKEGITNINLVNKDYSPKALKDEIDELNSSSYDREWIDDYSTIKNAFWSLLPITILGLMLPLFLLAINAVSMELFWRVIILIGFLIGFGVIIGYVWLYAKKIYQK